MYNFCCEPIAQNTCYIQTDFSLTQARTDQNVVRGHLFISSLATTIGAMTTWAFIFLLAGSHIEGERELWWAELLLLLSAGTFLEVRVRSISACPFPNILDTYLCMPFLKKNCGHSNSSRLPEVDISTLRRKSSTSQMKDTLVSQLNHRHWGC